MSTSLRGANLAGAEWAYTAGQIPIAGTHYLWVSHQDIDYLALKGVAFARLLFSWEILQPSLNGDLDVAYESTMSDRVNYATGKGMNVMIEPHGGEFTRFARYKGNPVGSAAVPDSAFADLWRRLAELHQGNSRVIFGLMNEPNNISTMQWFGAAQAAIVAIRATGATNIIMVPGNGFSQPSSWNDTWYDTALPQVSNAVGWKTLKGVDSLDKTVVSVHTYFDADAGGGADDIVGPNIIQQRLQPVVDWARPLGLKVHLSEFGANAATPGAQAAVANAIAYMDANCDVMIGWSWWAYGHPAWWGTYKFTLCPTSNYTVDNPKMAWLVPHFDAPSILCIRDNVADSGSEPNTTTTVAWESVDVWVRQFDDGITVGEPILGGSQCYVYVRVHNNGLSPSDGSEIVRLYWAKAQTGLSWPMPWNGSIMTIPKQGDRFDPPQPIGTIGCKQIKTIVFPWPAAPNPVDYGGDGHFCLLACIATTASPEFEGFSGSDLNYNVLKLNKVAWRNLHIIPVAKMKMGDVVVSNYTALDMHAWITFEILDASAKPINPASAKLLITPKGAALERLREDRQVDCPFLDDLGDGVFRVLDIATGISRLALRPGEALSFGLEYVPEQEAKGYVVRATQFSLEGASRKTIGGQTFVSGEVEGFTTQQTVRRRSAF